MTDVAPLAPTSTDGQPLGKRGQQTRERILDAVARLIEVHGLRGLKLADVADAVGFSPPAFYQYFNDLDDAILALCEQVGAQIRDYGLTGDGAVGFGDPGVGSRPFVEAFLAYWDEHRAVLTARNVAMNSGDVRFQQVRDRAFSPIGAVLVARIRQGQADGTIDPTVPPRALSASLTVMLDRIAMVGPQLAADWPETGTGLADAAVYIFDRALGFPGE